MIFKSNDSTAGTFEYMVVGLGNPGKKYEFTRHNTGFLCLDLFAEKHGFKIDRLKFKSLYADARINGQALPFPQAADLHEFERRSGARRGRILQDTARKDHCAV